MRNRFYGLLESSVIGVSGVTSVILAVVLILILFAWKLIDWHLTQRRNGKAGVEPNHLIIAALIGIAICFLVLAAAFFWKNKGTGSSIVTSEVTAKPASPDNLMLKHMIQTAVKESAINNFAEQYIYFKGQFDRAKSLKEQHDDIVMNKLAEIAGTKTLDCLSGHRSKTMHSVANEIVRMSKQDFPGFSFKSHISSTDPSVLFPRPGDEELATEQAKYDYRCFYINFTNAKADNELVVENYNKKQLEALRQISEQVRA